MTERTKTEHRLDLPFQAPPLTSNQRLHWGDKARRTRQVRTATHVLAQAAHLPKDANFATITLHYLPATNRRRDAHNLVPTVKAAVDGLVDYGLVPDDHAGFVSVPEPVIYPADKTPRQSRLWLEIVVEQEGVDQ